MKKVLVLGASGATGSLLVRRLLDKGVEVVALVRNAKSRTELFEDHSKLQVIDAEISLISEAELSQYIKDCDVVLSCLGHNINFKGIFGQPRLLVTDAVKKVLSTIKTIKPTNKIKFILMNTSGNSNRDIPEKAPFSQRLVTSLLRLVLPPLVDNEKAADYLRLEVGQKDAYIEWTAVRPDDLVNEDRVTAYEIHESPIRNVIFNAGSSSRINVADFMSELAINQELWQKWKGKMPVIYNQN